MEGTMRTKLTQAFATTATAEPGAERTVYWDASQAGFGLMVTSEGHRSFVVQYRADGTSRRMTLAATLTVEQARREARKLLGKVASGHDPLGEKRRKQAAAKDSLASIIAEYAKREHGKLRTAKWRM